MNIDLRTIPVYWATIERNIDRHSKMSKMFNHLDLRQTTQINGPISNPYTIGIADTHISGISNDLPLLMLEDDCAVTSDWNPVLNVPENTDAVYLGSSWYGMVQGHSKFRGCISSEVDDYYLRPYNMLGMHSVLYLTKEYRDKVIELLEQFKLNPGSSGCDECIAMNMKNYNILALKKPFFYQDDGHSNQETITPLTPYF
jgi:hypothetical protein